VPAERRPPRSPRSPGVKASDERAYLYRIIQTISAAPDLETVLRGIVRLLTEATGCHACFVYFVQDHNLVLRAASDVYAHLEGNVVLPMDKGLAGWVATTRRSAFIPEKALEDPRVVYVPEMEEERFQSMVSVPVFSRAGDVIGVINLHTEAPREFARDDLEFIEHTASLVAGAIENAQLYQQATERVAMLTELSQLAHRIALAGSVDELLATVTSGCRRAVQAERVEIYLLDSDGRLRLRAAEPPRSDAPVLDPELIRFEGILVGGAHASVEAQKLAAAVWRDRPDATHIFASLAASGDVTGLLCVLNPTEFPGAHSLVSAVASHATVALKHHELVGRLQEESLVKDFFEALSRGEASESLEAQARRLGVDLDGPLVVLHAVPWDGPPPDQRSRTRRPADPSVTGWADRVAYLEAGLASQLPGAVFDCRAASCRALVKAPPGRERKIAEVVRAVYDKVERDTGAAMTIGVSNTCRGSAAFPQGFDEAESAAEVGALIRDAPGVYTYEDLGPYRYVLSVEENVRDRHQERLERLVEYDRRRGTELLRTLEVYLENRGNIVGTARTVYAHPNTLRQRLARIEQLCGFDFEHEDWLSLGIAIKIVKLRMARESARERERVRAHRVNREHRNGGHDVD
jgi:GAF domain-containing protein